MGGNSLTVFFQIFHPLMWECNKTKREYLKMTSMNHIFWLFCVHKKKNNKKTFFCTAASCITHAVNTQMYAQHRRPLSLLPADKLASKETNRRVFFFLHAHLQRSSEPTKRNLPQTSWTVKRPRCLMTVMYYNPSNQGLPTSDQI